MATDPTKHPIDLYVTRHLRFGWCWLVPFLILGFSLETFHGLKIRWYLEDDMRRLMWTLGHTHGTLLSVLHICFALSLSRLFAKPARWLRVASACLVSASILMPGGFFLGGLFTYEGDPGLGVWLVPLGGLLLIVAVVSVALNSLQADDR